MNIHKILMCFALFTSNCYNYSADTHALPQRSIDKKIKSLAVKRLLCKNTQLRNKTMQQDLQIDALQKKLDTVQWCHDQLLNQLDVQKQLLQATVVTAYEAVCEKDFFQQALLAEREYNNNRCNAASAFCGIAYLLFFIK